MFRYTAPFVRYTSLTILSLLFVLCTSYAAAWMHAAKTQPLFDWYAPPRTLNTELKPTSTFSPGDALVLNVFVSRKAVNCWASHSHVLKGPVLYQFPSQRTNITEAVAADVELKIMLELPAKLPPGEYELYQLVTPTCNGFDKPTYRKNTDLTITVVR